VFNALKILLLGVSLLSFISLSSSFTCFRSLTLIFVLSYYVLHIYLSLILSYSSFSFAFRMGPCVFDKVVVMVLHQTQ